MSKVVPEFYVFLGALYVIGGAMCAAALSLLGGVGVVHAVVASYLFLAVVPSMAVACAAALYCLLDRLWP